MDGAIISPQHTFVVRLWAETTAANAVQWRGSVEHIASGQKFYFTSLNDLVGFIGRRIEAPSSDSQGKPSVKGGTA
ncbi:MAG TPA: hypothetical protein PKM21_15435 [Anaerolineales bacterium]|nr:hypothetical protein [Anaerolineales bacterium]